MPVKMLSCEIFRPELEMLAKEGVELPETCYLKAEMHNSPDKLRAQAQAFIDDFEAKNASGGTIIMGYGLCGRGLCNVAAKKSVLVFPRVHDCISLLLGKEHSRENALSREGAIYWSSPGMLEYFQINLHIDYDKRFAMLEERFGTRKALKMKKAELDLYRKYRNLTYIAWPEMPESYKSIARKVAASLDINYVERAGSSAMLRDLLAGGYDRRRFLRLEPGQGINMDLDGNIVSQP